MKANIHPQWYPEAKVTCACGHTFMTGSTLPEIRVEICSKCHPLFTGQTKFVDTLGQVERFQKRTEAAMVKAQAKQQAREARAAKLKEVKTDKPTLKDLLMQARKNLSS